MKTLLFLFAFLGLVATSAQGLPGDVDSLDVGNLDGIVYATASQPDGKIVLAGRFESVLGVRRRNIARLNSDGTLDASFDPSVNATVFSVAIQADGKMLIGGYFTTLNPNGATTATIRNRIARVNSDGTLDNEFNPNANDGVDSIALQADGKILIGGNFSFLKPNGAATPTNRNRIARLNTDGTLDTGFDPNTNHRVYSVALQADGKVILSGAFTTLRPNSATTAATRNRIARVNFDGTLDNSFDPNINDTVYSVTIQADGKILIGGQFSSLRPNGATTATARNSVARVNTDGTLDTGFDPNALDDRVYSVAVQADGKVLLGGSLYKLRPNGAGAATTRRNIARVNNDGTLDTGFNPSASESVRRVAVQADGKILLGGEFSSLLPNGATTATRRDGFARLFNDASTQSLTIASSNRIQWLRGGSSSEIEQVTFELSTDSGTSYIPLGAGTRISSGWELSGLALPNSGQIRARGRTSGDSSGLVETVANITDLATPEIAVSSNNTNIPTGKVSPTLADHTDFGTISVSGYGSTLTRTFTIANTGTADLTLGNVTIAGANAADFVVSRQPNSSVAASQSTTFTVSFDPSAIGLRSTTVSFTNDDADENQYSFTLQGIGFISSNADLSSLNLSAGILSPAFTSATTAYTMNVAYGDGHGNGNGYDGNGSSFRITPIQAEVNASIAVRLNGGSYAAVISGKASSALSLNVGANTLDVRVTSQDGTIIKNYTVTITRAAATPGDLDSLDIWINGQIYATALQPDGKTILAGRFTSVLGVRRNNIARLNADGTLDIGFDPNANYAVNSVAVQTDGKVLLGGDFTTLQPNGATADTFRSHIARVNADGTLDTGFDPQPDGLVNSLSVQSDGKVLVGGRFFRIGFSITIQPIRIARLNIDGTLDTSFKPIPNGDVNSIAVQADGKILLGGRFTSLQPNGATMVTTRNYIARVNADGTVDNSFNPTANGIVSSVAVQSDGKVLIGGEFTTVQPNGTATATVRNGIARVNANGTLDTGFDPNAYDGIVNSLAVQANGKVLLAGNFGSLQPNGAATATERNGMARLNPNGTLDSGFDPNPDGYTYSLAVQPDGKVLLGGSFFAFSPNGAVIATSRSGIALHINEPATQSLTIPSANRIQWLRGGSSPEVQQVTFELSTNRGNSYTPLGLGTRITGGWELTGLTLPGSGQIRARGRISSGYRNSASGLLETVASIAAPATPEIAVSGNSTNIPAGKVSPTLADNTDFGTISVSGNGSTLVRTFTIANTGTANLALGNVTVSGVNAADFTVSRQPNLSVVASQSTIFTVTFDPSTPGLRNATVNISNNDADENLFSFSLQGAGFTSSNADLSMLSLNAGTLTPNFSSATTAYSANLAYGDTSFKVSPIQAEVNASIAVRLNGGSYTTVTSGMESSAMSLNVGLNALDVRVTSQDGTVIKNYTVTINRAVAAPGDLDPLNINIDGHINATISQPDGKTILVGSFYSVLEVPRRHIARLNADGTLDNAFNPNLTGSSVATVAIQADGKILIGGYFESNRLSGAATATSRNCIARLNHDGTLDMDFDPNANEAVLSIAVQADGKILLGGEFTTLQPNGATMPTTRKRIARLNANGTLDIDFDPNVNSSEEGPYSGHNVSSILAQADGKILLGGSFTTLQPNGAATLIARKHIARLNADGTVDVSFDPNPNGRVSNVAVQADGKILVGGFFTTLQPNAAATATTRSGIARINADGTLDIGFNPNANGYVNSVVVQADGKILLGGGFYFLQPGGSSSVSIYRGGGIARVNSDGTVDTGFNPNPRGFTRASTRSVAIQADGRVLIAGDFDSLQPNGSVAETPRLNFAQLLNDPATQSLAIPSTNRIQWLRGGSSPEVEHVTFELSTDNGASYTSLGAGNRIIGGWELTELSLPASGQIRARGRTNGLFETVASFGTATPIEAWRQTYFGSSANTGNGADAFDFDQDGLSNIIEYAFGLNPALASSNQLPQPQRSGGNFFYQFSQPAGVSGITYGSEWSSTLLPGSWTTLPNTGTAPEHIFSVPTGADSKKFLRLKVTNP
jgi:uncharacterized delta-60 repeat protein